MNIDVFKDFVSVPGVARKMLFKQGLESGASFSLLYQKDEDLYDKIKASLIGGPSIITTRYHEVDKTFIRENKNKPCKAIEGYDFNSLYLFAIGQYMRRHEHCKYAPLKETR